MLVGAHAEVLNGLTSVPLATEQNRVGARRRAEGKLVEGKDLTTRLQDALLGGGGEAKGSDRELGDFKQTDVVGHGADSDDDLRITVGSALGLLDDAGEGNGGAVGLGEEKAVEDRLDGK